MVVVLQQIVKKKKIMWELIESLKHRQNYMIRLGRQVVRLKKIKVNISLGIEEIEIGRAHGRGF